MKPLCYALIADWYEGEQVIDYYLNKQTAEDDKTYMETHQEETKSKLEGYPYHGFKITPIFAKDQEEDLHDIAVGLIKSNQKLDPEIAKIVSDNMTELYE